MACRKKVTREIEKLSLLAKCIHDTSSHVASYGHRRREKEKKNGGKHSYR
jgi:hypothetical protein